MRHAIAILALLLATTSASARPHVLRDGANHHLGDDSFVARFGRVPTDADGEKLRMRVHLEYVRDLLAARPATSPALAGRRAELLGYLGDYIAKGITPVNTYVANRNPVFIDADGNICAVGYLIERSVDRALPETIARTHRLDYLEDIAAAMPEVSAWVASSGFTLDELASIQPGYPGPDVMHLVGWLTGKDAKPSEEWQPKLGEALPVDGPYHRDEEGTRLDGAFKHGKMVGTWVRKREGKILGTGKFTAGSGTWTSFRVDGSRLAEGAFVDSHAQGTWKIFHPSGRLAATGAMKRGARHGTWTFFYDNKDGSKLATGAFERGETIGGWKHFAETGKLVATVTGRAWGTLTIDIAANAAGVRHEVHQGIPAEGFRMDGLYLGTEKLYIDRGTSEMWNGDGSLVAKTDAGWVARSCKWKKARKAAARRGDASDLHDDMLKNRYQESKDGEPCDGAPVALAKERGKLYEKMIASRRQAHAPIPTFDVDPQPPAPADPDDIEEVKLGISDEDDDDEDAIGGADNPTDMATYLTQSATWYIEFPHVDSTFVTVYRSLPGYASTEGGLGG
jgi:hypothetical protein